MREKLLVQEAGVTSFATLCDTLTEILGEPYYQNDSVVLFCANATSLLRSLRQEEVFDLTVTSPPYNIGKEYEDIKPVSEYVEWVSDWVRNIYHVTRSHGSLLLNLGYIAIDDLGRAVPIPYLMWNKTPFYLNQEIVWNYGAGVACKNYLSPRNEKLLWYVKSPDKYTFNLDPIRDSNVKYPNSKKNGKLRVNTLGKNPSDVWQIAKVTTGKNRQSKERTEHPCQFPMDLIERAILGFSNEGDIVLDPFCGSGTVLLSCDLHKRYGVGIEINEDYCEIAKQRLISHSQAKLQTLF